MVTTRDGTVARKVRLLRNQGQELRYRNEVIGFNNRMTDIHASIGRVQLKRLHSWNERRQANAAYFDRHLDGVSIPQVAPECHHVYHQYTIRVTGRSRDNFAASLQMRGIGSGVYYPTPIHRLPAFQETLDLPETELAAAEVLSLPVHPSLSQGDLEKIVEAVNTLVSSGF